MINYVFLLCVVPVHEVLGMDFRTMEVCMTKYIIGLIFALAIFAFAPVVSAQIMRDNEESVQRSVYESGRAGLPSATSAQDWQDAPVATVTSTSRSLTIYVELDGFQPESRQPIVDYVRRYFARNYPGKYTFVSDPSRARHHLTIRKLAWQETGRQAVTVQPMEKLDRTLSWVSLGGRITGAVLGYGGGAYAADRIGWEAENARWQLGTTYTYQLMRVDQLVTLEVVIDDFEPVAGSDTISAFFDSSSDSVPTAINDPLTSDTDLLPPQSVGANRYMVCLSLRHRLDEIRF